MAAASTSLTPVGFRRERSCCSTSRELGELPPRRTTAAEARSLESSRGKCGTLLLWLEQAH